MRRVSSLSAARLTLGVLLLGAAGCTFPPAGDAVFSEDESYRNHGFNYAEEAQSLYVPMKDNYYDYRRGGYQGPWRNKGYHPHQGTSSRQAASSRASSSSSLHGDDFTAHAVPEKDDADRGSQRESSSGRSEAVSHRESRSETPQSKDHDDKDDDDNKGPTGGIGGRERN
jgi:hypothetical protein